ncbi:hypothetical protein GXM_07709 [Nostoc sphaeroides CCNUC1]|uniref:Uncharacterized protein n=1 Tax=Nostoc sphaeroides CCNUC1 TaxID=2653204 RepID=A0A5P8WBN9_9NOSO|nr:hypothetical protein GXM_07709 [Nostoc sphaeroides CCNUC1]
MRRSRQSQSPKRSDSDNPQLGLNKSIFSVTSILNLEPSAVSGHKNSPQFGVFGILYWANFETHFRLWFRFRSVRVLENFELV